ncbi:MAG: hypothetical protein PQJ59_10125 [Spirochaetales bacterium]|nr:hypothetical protein [Spirochaetales bacterium]
MKKVCLIFLGAALLLAPLSAAPTEEEVGETLGGVMMVYSLILMGSMFGSLPPGAVAELDHQSGNSSLVCKDVDVTALMETQAGMGMGAAMNGEGENPPIRFTRMSGDITADAMGNVLLDVQLTGGPVKKMIFAMEGEVVTQFKADGKDYRYLTSDPYFMGSMGM